MPDTIRSRCQAIALSPVGITEIGTLTHRLEDLLNLFIHAEGGLKRESFDLLLLGIDALSEMVQSKTESLSAPIDNSKALEMAVVRTGTVLRRVPTSTLTPP